MARFQSVHDRWPGPVAGDRRPVARTGAWHGTYMTGELLAEGLLALGAGAAEVREDGANERVARGLEEVDQILGEHVTVLLQEAVCLDFGGTTKYTLTTRKTGHKTRDNDALSVKNWGYARHQKQHVENTIKPYDIKPSSNTIEGLLLTRNMPYRTRDHQKQVQRNILYSTQS